MTYLLKFNYLISGNAAASERTTEALKRNKAYLVAVWGTSRISKR